MEQPLTDGSALPSEIWEDVILRLSPFDILLMRLLNREFRELIDTSPAIKYHLDLFSAGLTEGVAGNSLGLQDRRQKLEGYYSMWKSFDRAKRIILDPPHGPDVLRSYVDKGFLVHDMIAGGGKVNIHFTRLPSVAMGIPQKEWTVRGLPDSSTRGHQRAIHPPSNLLAIPVLSGEESSFQIELFQMSDGKPYPNDAHSPAMGSSYEPLTRIIWVQLQLTGCRLAARVVMVQMDDALDLGATDFFVWDWKTGDMCMEHIQTQSTVAYFIDEYRLFGTVCPDRTTMLMLWDTSNPMDLQDPPGLIFEPGPDHVYSNVDRSVRNYETNHTLPFHECPSMGIVGFVARVGHPVTKLMIRKALILPVKTLASFARRIGTTSYVPWREWQDLVIPIELPLAPLHTHVLHSQMLSIGAADNSPGSTSILRVWDFSLHSRRQAQDDPSAPFPPYAVREIQLDADYHNSSFDFTGGGVLVAFDVEGGRREQHFWAF